MIAAIVPLLAAAEPTQSNDVRVAIITVIGVVAAAIFSYLAARYSARQATKASKNTDHVTERQVDVSEWTALVGSLQTEVKRLADRVTDLETTATANRGRIETLESTVRKTETKYHVAIQYIRDVVQWTHRIVGSDKVPPTPPAEIEADLNVIRNENI